MQLYLQVATKNIFLLLITAVMLFLTVGFWFGLPLIGLPNFYIETDVPIWIQFISIYLGIGFCFSLFLIPFHLSFAKAYASKKQKNKVKIFFLIQGTLITLVATLSAIFILIVSIFSTN